MRSRFHHSGPREKRKKILLFRFLSVLVGSSILVAPAFAQKSAVSPEEGPHYQINLSLDFDNRTYTGTERVHWVNGGDHSTSTLFFHLYPNMRPPDYVAPATRNQAGQIISDE